jgi:hypothetical protein
LGWLQLPGGAQKVFDLGDFVSAAADKVARSDRLHALKWP